MWAASGACNSDGSSIACPRVLQARAWDPKVVGWWAVQQAPASCVALRRERLLVCSLQSQGLLMSARSGGGHVAFQLRRDHVQAGGGARGGAGGAGGGDVGSGGSCVLQ